MGWTLLCPKSSLDYFLTFLPLLSAVICGLLIVRVFRLRSSVYFLFFLVAALFSALILMPVLIVPAYGVFGFFYVYAPLLRMQDTLGWHAVILPKDSYKVVFLILLFTWFNIAVTAGPFLVSRLMGLSAKKSSLLFILFVYSTVLLTLGVAWGISLVLA